MKTATEYAVQIDSINEEMLDAPEDRFNELFAQKSAIWAEVHRVPGFDRSVVEELRKLWM